MFMISIELLKTAFFLQGSYALTYVPIMIILLMIGLQVYARLSFVASILIAIQCVFASYLMMLIITGIIGFICTYYNYPLISHGLKRSLHYNIAVVISTLFYAILQSLFLSVQKNRMEGSLILLILICNILTAVIMIGLNSFLFVRHL